MRNVLSLALLALVAAGCVTQEKSMGDDMRTEYPPYDGPQLAAVIIRFENKAEDPNYSELGQTAADVLATELSRSRSIRVQNRQDIGDIQREWAFSGAAEAAEMGTDPGMTPNRPDVVIKGVVTNYGQRIEQAGFLVYQTKQIAQVEVDIYIINMHTGEQFSANYGQATVSIAATGGLGAGTATTYDRTLARKALRAAIGDCWTQMMGQLRAVNPGRPAG